MDKTQLKIALTKPTATRTSLRNEGRPGYAGEERRCRPRVYARFPAHVWGVDWDGRKFEIDAWLENLSSEGLCTCLSRQVELGEQLLFHVRFTEEHAPEQKWPRIAVHGMVVRSVERPDGSWETAVMFAGHVVF